MDPPERPGFYHSHIGLWEVPADQTQMGESWAMFGTCSLSTKIQTFFIHFSVPRMVCFVKLCSALLADPAGPRLNSLDLGMLGDLPRLLDVPSLKRRVWDGETEKSPSEREGKTERETRIGRACQVVTSNVM